MRRLRALHWPGEEAVGLTGSPPNRDAYSVSSNVVLQRMDEGEPFVQLPDLAKIDQPVSKEAARAGLHTFPREARSISPATERERAA